MESFFKDHFSKAFADGFPRVFPSFFRFVRVPVVVIVAVVVVVVDVDVAVVVYLVVLGGTRSRRSRLRGVPPLDIP